MSISKTKNLERRLTLLADEASIELNKVCESTHWRTLGFVFLDQIKDSEKIAKANFYYGRLQLIEEIMPHL